MRYYFGRTNDLYGWGRGKIFIVSFHQISARQCNKVEHESEETLLSLITASLSSIRSGRSSVMELPRDNYNYSRRHILTTEMQTSGWRKYFTQDLLL